MFDLEKQIAVWRKQMLAAGIKAPAPLDELEIHLREEIERQMKSGLNPNEQAAFENAAQKIGRPGELKAEFNLAAGFESSRQRRRVGFIYAVILGLYALIFADLLFKNDLAFTERLLGLAAVATALLVNYAAWQFASRIFPVIISRRLQSAVGLIGGVSGIAWFLAFAYLILPRCNFMPGQLFVVVVWALVPVMSLPALTFLGLEKSEPRPFPANRLLN